MGLFDNKQTFVSSVAYNLAGDETQRPNFLKSMVSGSVVSGSKLSIAETIQQGLMNGPAGNLKAFHRWAQSNYDNVGVPTSLVTGQIAFDYEALQDAIGITFDSTNPNILSIDAGPADFSWWAEQWMLENNRAAINTLWTCDIDESTNVITITYENGTTATFSPSFFDKTKTFLYVVHTGLELKDRNLRYVFIYGFGHGNAALDAAILSVAPTTDEFFPIIPVRLNNNFLSSTNHSVQYADAKKAYKKATGDDYDDLVSKLADNSSLGDIDYAYVVFGASLNTKDNYLRRYIYGFFQYLMLHQPTDTATYAAYQAAYATFIANGGDAADAPAAPYLPKSQIRVATGKGWGMNYDVRISWAAISEEVGSGVKWAGAKPGDTKFETNASDAYSYTVDAGITLDRNVERASLHWQVDADSWRTIHLYGLVHHNYIYHGKYVETKMLDALNDTDVSGFIIPLHFSSFKSLPATISTQASTGCAYIVFNCYKVVKKKWYETGLFKLVVLIVIIAVVIAFPPAGGAGAGVLGSAAAVGAAIGLTGLAAIIAGTILNMIAAMLITAVLQKAGKAAFGDKFGELIGTIAAAVAITVGGGLANGGSLASSWSGMMSAGNLIQLTSVVGNGIANYVQLSAQDTLAQAQELSDEYAKQSEHISELFAQNIGYDMGSINTLGLTDISFGNLTEPPSAFLTRTLMTGSDIAEMSMNMLSSFADLTLSTDLPLTQ